MQALSTKPQKWQAAQRAYQDYRAGERQAYAQPSTAAQSRPKPWWQRAWTWVQQKVVQPVRQVVSRLAASQAGVAAPSRGNLTPPAKPSLWSRFIARLKNFAAPMVNAIKTKVVNAWHTIKTKAAQAWKAIKTNAAALWNTAKTKLQDSWNRLKTWMRKASQGIGSFFRTHPVIAWGTAGALTAGAAVGARNLYCYGSLLPPVSSLHLTSWFALPLAGLLTTDRKHKLYGVFVGLMVCGILLSACAPKPETPTPPLSICPEPPTSPPPTQTPNLMTQTAMAGTPTPVPCLVTNEDQLNTKWGFDGENSYNQAILNASNSSGVPAWVLKGLIAAESGFNPTAVSPFAAYGLTQITGSGMGFLVGKNEDIAKTEIQNAWKLMTPDEQAQFPPLPSLPSSKQKSWHVWYDRLDQYTLKPIMQKYMLSSIDGQCTPADITIGRCFQEGQIDQAQIQKNITYGALILAYSLDEIKTTALQNGVNWESLPLDVQFWIAIANYNLSAGSGEAGKYIGPAMQACAGDLTWNCISKKLGESGAPLTPSYADKAINYAQQGCMP